MYCSSMWFDSTVTSTSLMRLRLPVTMASGSYNFTNVHVRAFVKYVRSVTFHLPTMSCYENLCLVLRPDLLNLTTH